VQYLSTTLRLIVQHLVALPRYVHFCTFCVITVEMTLVMVMAMSMVMATIDGDSGDAGRAWPSLMGVVAEQGGCGLA
jgi:hypothetical protein